MTIKLQPLNHANTIRENGYDYFRKQNPNMRQDELEKISQILKNRSDMENIDKINKTIYELNEEMLADVAGRIRAVRDLTAGEVEYLIKALKCPVLGQPNFDDFDKEELLEKSEEWLKELKKVDDEKLRLSILDTDKDDLKAALTPKKSQNQTMNRKLK